LADGTVFAGGVCTVVVALAGVAGVALVVRFSAVAQDAAPVRLELQSASAHRATWKQSEPNERKRRETEGKEGNGRFLFSGRKNDTAHIIQ